jgi:hypothetical protein
MCARHLHAEARTQSDNHLNAAILLEKHVQYVLSDSNLTEVSVYECACVYICQYVHMHKKVC